MIQTRTRPAAADRGHALLDFAASHSPTIFYGAELGIHLPARYISSNVETITDHGVADFLGEAGYGRRFIHPEDFDDYVEQRRRLREVGSLVHEYRFRTKSGAYLWFRDELRVANDEHGTEIIGCIIDITQEKIAEGERARLARRFQDAVESIDKTFTVVDRDNRILACNSYLARDLGLDPNDLAGHSRDILLRARLASVRRFDGETVDGSEACFERISHRLRTADGEALEIERMDGSVILLSCHATSEGGQVTNGTDITRIKEVERRLAESEAMVRRVIEAAPVPISMVRAEDGEILFENPVARTSSKNTTSRWADPSQRDAFVERLRLEREVENEEVELRRGDGTVFSGAQSCRLIEYDGEETIITSVFDLSERLEMEAAMTRQREILHQSEKLTALGELLASVAHELNNPLSVDVGQTFMLKETASDAATAKRAERIGSAADRCARIVKTFLAMARERPREMASVDANALVNSALEITGYSLRASGVDVGLSLGRDLPAFQANANQLTQVFTNLIVNAEQALRDAPEPRRLRITTRVSHAGDELLVKFKDNGPGVPEALQRRIFDPVYTTKEVGAGTGIRLSICHRVLEDHGGRVKVETTPGGGATFVVRLPIRKPSIAACRVSAKEAEDTRRLAVLVIDDEPDVA